MESVVSESDLIRYWAYLCESGDRLCDSYADWLAYESGGTEPKDIEAKRMEYVMGEFLTRILENAREGDGETTDPKQIGEGFVVSDVHRLRKPFDVVVQWVEGGKVRTARIEDKATEQSSVFEKTMHFTLKRDTNDLLSINFDSAKPDANQSNEDAQNWKQMFSIIPPKVKEELNESLKNLIVAYNDARRKKDADNTPNGNGTSQGIIMRIGDDSTESFDKETMDELLVKIKSTLTKPFDFTVDMICGHFNGTHYLHIGSFFYKFTDKNPLKLRRRKGLLAKVDDIFGHAKAKFQVKERDGRYAIILHVYNLVRRDDELSDVVRDNTLDENPQSDEIGESDDGEDGGSMTLDELMHQQPS